MLKSVRSNPFLGGPLLNFLIILELGDPVDDLAVATVLMMVGGKLALLKPRKVRTSLGSR